jgi:hypothetical protein
MSTMATPRIKRTSGRGSRVRTFKGYQITRLQHLARENERGYYKSTHLLTVPHEFVKDLSLQRGDIFCWSLVKDSPPTMLLTKVIVPKSAEVKTVDEEEERYHI